MASELINLFIGIAIGFAIGVYWMTRRSIRASDQPSASQLKDIARDDTGDPLEDVDRRMAYGAYEAAAEIVTAQIAEHPENVQLKAKLLEIYFVWGSEEKFLATFREHEDELRRSKDWAKLNIMGGELCPDDPMFEKS